MAAPAAAQGSFIPAGNVFDVMAAISKLLSTARSNVLFIDPYMDEKALIDFAILIPEKIVVRLLADQAYQKPSLEPAVKRWVAQYAATRPLEAKLAPARSIHDRLIIVDDTNVWDLTQSFNAFATRAPATIVRFPDPGLKIASYQGIWGAATPV